MNKIKEPQYNRANLIISIFAVIIAGIAAFYNLRQTEIAENTAQRQLRAYLGVDMDKQTWGMQPDNNIFVKFKVINYGQTPASSIQIRGSVSILPTYLSNSYSPIYRPFVFPESRSVIFPNATDQNFINIIKTANPVKMQEFKQAILFKSDIRIYVFISLSYNDIFNIKRHTYFCSYLIPEFSNMHLGDSTGWIWNIAKNHNNSD